jgi:hypothetical protein
MTNKLKTGDLIDMMSARFERWRAWASVPHSARLMLRDFTGGCPRRCRS